MGQSNAFHGPVARKVDEVGFRNYCNLLLDGYAVRVFLDEVEQMEYIAANPEEGWVRGVSMGCSVSAYSTLKGIVEVRIERSPRRGRNQTSL
jgi:hypothetical protein